MRGFQQHSAEFSQRHVAIAAVSVDSPEESQKLVRSEGFTFPFLSDQQAQTIRAFGLLHPKAGIDGHDIARPAEYFIDPSGTIRWVNLTDDFRVRARPEETLAAIDRVIANK